MTPLARRLRFVVPCLVLVALAYPSVCAYADGAPARPAAAETLRAAPPAAPSGNIQRLLAEADSMLKVRGGSHAAEAQLFLSWGAPWGSPGARTSFVPACSDTLAVDTLYLSFVPGREAVRFAGFTADLAFHAPAADTLGSWWHMESKGGANGGNLLVEFGPWGEAGPAQPWRAGGQGFTQLERRPDEMRLRILFAVSQAVAGPVVSDSMYSLCRVLVRHRRTDRLAGCGQPVCVEWVRGTLAFALKDAPEVRRGERFVSWGRGACESFRGPRVPTWEPPKRPSRP